MHAFLLLLLFWPHPDPHPFLCSLKALKYCHTSAKDRTLLTPKQLPKGIRAMTGIPWESHQEKEKGPLESHLSSVCTAPLHIYISCTKRGMYPDALSKFSGEKISSVKTVGLMKITSLALKGQVHPHGWRKKIWFAKEIARTNIRTEYTIFIHWNAHTRKKINWTSSATN